jgi:hypothetical protein
MYPQVVLTKISSIQDLHISANQICAPLGSGAVGEQSAGTMGRRKRPIGIEDPQFLGPPHDAHSDDWVRDQGHTLCGVLLECLAFLPLTARVWSFAHTSIDRGMRSIGFKVFNGLHKPPYVIWWADGRHDRVPERSSEVMPEKQSQRGGVSNAVRLMFFRARCPLRSGDRRGVNEEGRMRGVGWNRASPQK